MNQKLSGVKFRAFLVQLNVTFKPPGRATIDAKVQNCENSRNSIGISVVAPKRDVPRQGIVNPKVFLAEFRGLEVTF